jgi:hypothetical protein
MRWIGVDCYKYLQESIESIQKIIKKNEYRGMCEGRETEYNPPVNGINSGEEPVKTMEE